MAIQSFSDFFHGANKYLGTKRGQGNVYLAIATYNLMLDRKIKDLGATLLYSTYECAWRKHVNKYTNDCR
jgi:hypothetical protein